MRFVDVSRFSRELQGARFASKTGDGLRRRRYQSGGFETEFAVLMSANLDDGDISIFAVGVDA